MTPNRNRTRSVSTIEMTIEPAQPSRFEKKKNMDVPYRKRAAEAALL
jgi:hypothetical protein